MSSNVSIDPNWSVNETNLHLAINILDRADVHYWVDQGTLLGIIRDKQLLAWDKDIDLTVWDTDFDVLAGLKEQFEQAGFYFELHEEGDCLFLSRGDGYFVDIARYHRDGDYAERRISKPKLKTWQRLVKRGFASIPSAIRNPIRHISRIVFRGEMIKIRVPAHFFDNLDEFEFLGLHLKKPAETEAYLQLKYGDWKTPVQDWDYSKQDGGVVTQRH